MKNKLMNHVLTYYETTTIITLIFGSTSFAILTAVNPGSPYSLVRTDISKIHGFVLTIFFEKSSSVESSKFASKISTSNLFLMSLKEFPNYMGESSTMFFPSISPI